MIVGLTWLWSSRQSPQATKAPPRKESSSVIEAIGLTVANTRNIAIATPISGIVDKVEAKVGSCVKVGEPLFTLDTRSIETQLAGAKANVLVMQANVAVAESQLALSQSNYQRVEKVQDRRAISIEEIENRKYVVQANEAGLTSARAALAQAIASQYQVEVGIQMSTVRSPIDGMVLQTNILEGEYAQSGALPTPLMLVGNIHPMWIRVGVRLNDVWRFNPNAEAVAILRGNPAVRIPLQLVQVQPYMVEEPGQGSRVLRVIYSFDPTHYAVYVGQELDVVIQPSSAAP